MDGTYKDNAGCNCRMLQEASMDPSLIMRVRRPQTETAQFQAGGECSGTTLILMRLPWGMLNSKVAVATNNARHSNIYTVI